MQLKSKIAVVTGGSRGIGKSIAKNLLEEGCKVVVCGKNKKNLDETKKELKVEGFLCDISNPKDIKKFASSVAKKFGHVDILVNNAGVGHYKSFKDMKEDEIVKTIDVNLRGLILMTKYLLPKISKNGLIVNISSGAGKYGIPGMAAYCASKFGVIGFTKALSGELDGIKVVAICPGGVDTDMYRSMSGHRPGLKPEHIAKKVLQVCLKPSKFKQGQSIQVYSVRDVGNYIRRRYFGKGNL